jgi:hypothetical protein
MLKGYEALEALGKSGNAHIMLGDWSKIPNFLFPPSLHANQASNVSASTAAR